MPIKIGVTTDRPTNRPAEPRPASVQGEGTATTGRNLRPQDCNPACSLGLLQRCFTPSVARRGSCQATKLFQTRPPLLLLTFCGSAKIAQRPGTPTFLAQLANQGVSGPHQPASQDAGTQSRVRGCSKGPSPVRYTASLPPASCGSRTEMESSRSGPSQPAPA